MASSAPRNSLRPPAYQICVDDRASFSNHFNTLFSEGVLFVRPQTALWLALQKLVAKKPRIPAIVSRQFISAEMLESWTLDGEGFFRKFLARYITETLHGPTEVVLTLQVDRDMSQVFLESAELNRAGVEYHPVVESLQSRQQESQRITSFSARPGIHLRVDRDQSERDRQSERRENERIRSLGGMIQFPLLGHEDLRWSAFDNFGWDMLDRAMQAESTRRLNEILSGRKSSIPTACQGCANYYGKTHGGNTLICAMHPHGADSDSCADFEGVTNEA